MYPSECMSEVSISLSLPPELDKSVTEEETVLHALVIVDATASQPAIHLG